MTEIDIENALKTAVCIVDTREHLSTDSVRERLRAIGLPLHREELSFGDYSVYCYVDGIKYSLADNVVVERKMSLNELSGNFFQNRKRFENEFERARKRNAKIYLLVENGSIDKIYAHKYRTKVHPNSYIATLLAWLSRYNMTVLFCKPENSGRLIHDILMRELKEHLMRMVDEDG